jgi:hypothetical protein
MNLSTPLVKMTINLELFNLDLCTLKSKNVKEMLKYNYKPTDRQMVLLLPIPTARSQGAKIIVIKQQRTPVISLISQTKYIFSAQLLNVEQFNINAVVMLLLGR